MEVEPEIWDELHHRLGLTEQPSQVVERIRGQGVPQDRSKEGRDYLVTSLGWVSEPAVLYATISDPVNIRLMETDQLELYACGLAYEFYGRAVYDSRFAMRVPHDGDWVVAVDRFGLDGLMDARSAKVKVTLQYDDFSTPPLRTRKGRIR